MDTKKIKKLIMQFHNSESAKSEWSRYLYAQDFYDALYKECVSELKDITKKERDKESERLKNEVLTEAYDYAKLSDLVLKNKEIAKQEGAQIASIIEKQFKCCFAKIINGLEYYYEKETGEDLYPF